MMGAMEIVVRGKNVKVPPALQETTRDKLAKFERLNLKMTRIEVDYSEIRNPRVHDKELCEVTVHLKGHFVKAHAASTDQTAALDLVIDKVEHQLTRLKGKKVGRSHPDEAVRVEADGARRGRVADGPARPRLLPVHERGERTCRGALPPSGRPPGPHRGGGLTSGSGKGRR
jgi:ribosomal subunit interface protein